MTEKECEDRLICSQLLEKAINQIELPRIKIDRLQKEIEKKDKLINEIIDYIATRIWATCPNEDYGVDLDCENRCSNDEDIYKKCWKMYFERKIEE